MTTLRFEYRTHAAEMLKSMRELSAQLKAAGIGQRLVDLVYLRVSQINGCAYCVNLHTNALRQVDEPQVRLDQLVVWRHSPHFTERTVDGRRADGDILIRAADDELAR